MSSLEHISFGSEKISSLWTSITETDLAKCNHLKIITNIFSFNQDIFPLSFLWIVSNVFCISSTRICWQEMHLVFYNNFLCIIVTFYLFIYFLVTDFSVAERIAVSSIVCLWLLSENISKYHGYPVKYYREICITLRITDKNDSFGFMFWMVCF